MEGRKMLWRGQRRATPAATPEDSWFKVFQGMMPAASDEQRKATPSGAWAPARDGSRPRRTYSAARRTSDGCGQRGARSWHHHPGLDTALRRPGFGRRYRRWRALEPQLHRGAGVRHPRRARNRCGHQADQETDRPSRSTVTPVPSRYWTGHPRPSVARRPKQHPGHAGSLT